MCIVNLLIIRGLSGNRIRCDCKLSWFIAFRSSIVNPNSSIGECHTPANLTGTSLRQVTEEELVCGKSLTVASVQ